MATSNKVKFGLKNVHYAKATFDSDGEVTYDTPVSIPGAVSLSLEAEGEPENFYADDIAYYVVSNNSGYSGDLELALIPDRFRTDILNETVDNSGLYVEDANAEVQHFALLFEFSGDVNKTRHVFYNCTCARPATASQTIEETREVQTETLSLTASPLASGYVRAKTPNDGTATTAYSAWFTKVQEPSITAG